MRGLADAGLADVQRIVLAAAAQHLDGALDLLLAADQRVDLALARLLVEVAGRYLSARLLRLRPALASRSARPSSRADRILGTLAMPWEM
jgi:hypothetical protein